MIVERLEGKDGQVYKEINMHEKSERKPKKNGIVLKEKEQEKLECYQYNEYEQNYYGRAIIPTPYQHPHITHQQQIWR